MGEGRTRGEGRREREAPRPAGADARPAPTPTPRLREEPRGPAKSRPYGAAGSQLRPGERAGGAQGMEGGLLSLSNDISGSHPVLSVAPSRNLLEWKEARPRQRWLKKPVSLSTQDLEAKVVVCYPRNGGK